METVSFISVLNAVARRCGIDPQVELEGRQAEELTDYINGAFRAGWEQEWWPDWTITQACALTAGSTSLPGGTETCNDVTRPGPGASGAYIDLDTGGALPMGTIKAIAVRDPQGHIGEKQFLDFQLSARGIELPGWLIGIAETGKCLYDGTPTLWVTCRLRPPVFTWEEWVEGQTYQMGEVVLRKFDCYAATAVTATDPLTAETPWAIQSFPRLLERFVIAQAASEALAMADRPAASTKQSGKAAEALEEELTKRGIQQGQTRRYRVRTR